MVSYKVLAVLLLVNILQAHGSVLGPAVAAVPAIRYSLVAPQNVRPFAAQVATFTKGLSVYAAPYAAGVLGGPAIVPAAPAVAPAPVYPEVLPAAAVAPAPYYPGGVPAVAHALAPAAAPAIAPAVAPAAWAPAAPVAAPAHLLPAPFARSVHAVAPGYAAGYAPALGPPLPAASYLG